MNTVERRNSEEFWVTGPTSGPAILQQTIDNTVLARVSFNVTPPFWRAQTKPARIAPQTRWQGSQITSYVPGATLAFGSANWSQRK